MKLKRLAFLGADVAAAPAPAADDDVDDEKTFVVWFMLYNFIIAVVTQHPHMFEDNTLTHIHTHTLSTHCLCNELLMRKIIFLLCVPAAAASEGRQREKMLTCNLYLKTFTGIH